MEQLRTFTPPNPRNPSQAQQQPQSLSRQNKCDCLESMMAITAQIPSADVVKMGVIFDVSQQVTERWKRVNSCKRCQLSRPMLQTLANASHKIVTLHEAASVLFADQDRGEPTPRSELSSSSGHSIPVTSSVTCCKSQTSLGAFVLDEEEANELIRDLIFTQLKTLNSLLKGLLYYMAQDGSMVKTGNVCEVEEHVKPIVSRLLRVLGRTKSSSWPE